MLIRDRGEADLPVCVDLLMKVHERDGYPLFLPAREVTDFFRSGHEQRAWVAEVDGRIVGHVALHCRTVDPTIEVAQRATGLPPERLAMVARLFVNPGMRRAGVARALVRHAVSGARSLGRRAVLDVGQSLHGAVALYESEGWSRVGELHLPLEGHPMLDLWVYVSQPV